MHTDYQAVARQLEWLADGLPDADASKDLRALARNVRLLGVMTRMLDEARRRRRVRELFQASTSLVDPLPPDDAALLPFHPCA